MVEKIKNSMILHEFIEFGVFVQISYSLGERTNQNSEIMALIGKHSASLRVLRALVGSSTLVASSTLVT